MIPDAGTIWLDGAPISFTSPNDARAKGIETVYQTLAMSPALSIADNMFMGRELRRPGFMGTWLRKLDHKAMEDFARKKLSDLGLTTIQTMSEPSCQSRIPCRRCESQECTRAINIILASGLIQITALNRQLNFTSNRIDKVNFRTLTTKYYLSILPNCRVAGSDSSLSQ